MKKQTMAEEPLIAGLEGFEPAQSCLFYRKVHRYAKRLRKLKMFPELVEAGNQPIQRYARGPCFENDDGYDRIKCSLYSTETAIQRLMGLSLDFALLAVSRQRIKWIREDSCEASSFLIYVEIYYRAPMREELLRARCRAEHLSFEMSMAIELEIMNLLLQDKRVFIEHA
ncbi:hypothetical protein [Caballeronia grimmiae]|uniref:hypothetical protein n=1 Tax=Caballeronia grimmiae TaxID=1071679 RepID=UPI0038BC677F